MPEKRMLIVPAELVSKIDENRGDMNRADFLDFLIDSQLKEEKKGSPHAAYATKEDLRSLEQDVKKLLKSFVDFFVSYGLELGKHPAKSEFEALASKLEGLEEDESSGDSRKEARIKWK